MEFEEMQKIWNEQSGEHWYGINEAALYKRVMAKSQAASKRINLVEIALMMINGTVATMLLVDAYLDKGLWDYILGFLMLLTVILLFVFRRKRIKEESKFDRTMLGELDHAIANTRSLVHISNMMIYCYLLPVGLFTIGKLIYFDASSGKWLLLVAMYAVAYFLIRWERKYQHLPRKANLEILRAKLMEDK